MASKLILQGWQISLNAAFCVLDELCRPPLSVDVSKGRLRELLAEWTGGPDHNLKIPVLSAAHCLIDGKKLPWREGVQLMLQIDDYDGQRAALAIAYFASDCGSPRGDEALNQADADIRARWAAKNV
ncbi:MAG: hypothetical protein WBF87_13095 [Mesorhizobium sp.]